MSKASILLAVTHYPRKSYLISVKKKQVDVVSVWRIDMPSPLGKAFFTIVLIISELEMKNTPSQILSSIL
jgi:hypothetical protein